MSRLCDLETQIEDTQSQLDAKCVELAALQQKVAAKTLPAYRYVTTPGAEYEWWNADDGGPHVNPRTWDGPADQYGYPSPSANPPTASGTTTNVANINDSNTSGAAMRAGKIRLWVYLPDGAWIRDNNANTGELGYIDIGSKCSGSMAPTPGANTDTNTSGADRGLMDANGPYKEGWYFVVQHQSDLSAFGGLDLDISEDGGTTWRNVALAETSSTLPVVETIDVPFCDDLPEGYQWEALDDCCQPRFQPSGGVSLEAVQTLIDAQNPQPATSVPIPDNEIDTAIRTGQVGTSTDYARADHNHPIRRQANPGDPVLTFVGNSGSDMTQQLILDRESDEESFAFKFRTRWAVVAGNGWNYINVPTIAGFQQPEIYGIGTYRTTSNAPQEDNGDNQGASPRGPYMGKEAHEWSSTRRIYLAHFRRENNYTKFVEFWVRYTRI